MISKLSTGLNFHTSLSKKYSKVSYSCCRSFECCGVVLTSSGGYGF